MYKSLLKDSAIYSVSTMLARGFSLITVPIFTRILTPSDYGALDILSYSVTIFALFLGLGLDQAVARFYYDSEGTDKKKAIASSVLAYNLIAPIPIVLVGALLSDKIAGTLLRGQVSAATIIAAFFLLWSNCIFIITMNQLRYQLQAKKYMYCSIGNTILSLSLSLWFVASLKLGVLGVFVAQCVSAACFSGVAYLFSRKSYGWTFNWFCFKELTYYSLPLVPGTMAIFATQYMDRYVLTAFRSLTDVGIYGIGSRIASLVYLFLTGFQGAWAPIVMKTYNDPESAERFKRILDYFVFITAVGTIWVSFFSKEILVIFTTQSYVNAYILVPFLLCAIVLSSIGNYFTYGIQIAKKSGLRLKINLSGLAVSTILSIVFISAFGLFGAAVASFLSTLIVFIWAMSASQRYYYVPYNWLRIGSSMIFTLAISYLVIICLQEVSLKFAIIKAGLACIVTVVIALLLKTHSILRIPYRILRQYTRANK